MKNECLSPVSHIRRAWSSAAKARPAIRRTARRRAGQHMTGQLQGAAKESDATGTGQGCGQAIVPRRPSRRARGQLPWPG